MSEKETVANWMMANGFATGHGDSVADMLNELAWQIDDRVAFANLRAIDAERVAFANLCNKNANAYLSEGQNEAARAAVALAVITLEKVRKND